MKRIYYFIIFVLLILTLGACNSPINEATTSDAPLNVVTTTSIVNDVVSNVGGDMIHLESLLPVGTNPHSFSATPQDMAKLADADLLIANGAGLELFLADMIENTGADSNIIYLSEANDLIASAHSHDEDNDHDHEAEETEHDHEEGEDDDHDEFDPHTWISPKNVIEWVNVIADELSRLDPENATFYQANATTYLAELNDLDTWVEESVATIPVENRKLVTDHLLFGYFCRDYGFEQAGAVIQSSSTLAEPSAQELAELEELIEHEGVKAIFVGNTVSSELSQRIADDTGAQLYFFYSGSLSDQDGDAKTYVDYIKYNVNTIINALAE